MMMELRKRYLSKVESNQRHYKRTYRKYAILNRVVAWIESLLDAVSAKRDATGEELFCLGAELLDLSERYIAGDAFIDASDEESEDELEVAED